LNRFPDFPDLRREKVERRHLVSLSSKSKALLGAVACALILSTEANAAGREIYVNGQRLNAVEIFALDLLNCGSAVPNGRYWINWVTRAWGFEGGPQQDFLPQCEQQAETSSGHGSGSGGFWEDRMFELSGISTVQNPVYR
jgi:hypothetical protein